MLQNHFQRGMEMKQKSVSPSKALVSSSTGRDLPCMWDKLSIHMYALLLEPNLTQLLTRATFGGVFSLLRILQNIEYILLHSHLTPALPPSEATHSDKPQTFGLSHARYLEPLELLLALHRHSWGGWVCVALHHLAAMWLHRGGVVVAAVHRCQGRPVAA